MNGSTRRQHTPEFKAKVAIEAIKGQQTLNEVASLYGIHPVQVAQWKKQALTGLAEVFANRRAKTEADTEGLQARLYQQIGQLQVELEWLKRKTGLAH